MATDDVETHEPSMSPAQALEWLDTATEEFFGAIEACSEHIAANVTEPNMVLETSGRLNTFMFKLMQIAQTGQAAIANGEVPAEVAALAPTPEAA